MASERDQSFDNTTTDSELVLEKIADDSVNVRIRPPGSTTTFSVQVSDREGSWIDENTGLTGDTDLKLQLTERFVRVTVTGTGSGTSDVLLSSGGTRM